MKSFFLKAMLLALIILNLSACKKKETNSSKSNTETKEKTQSKGYSQEELEVAKYELEDAILKAVRKAQKQIHEDRLGASALGITIESIAGADWEEKEYKKFFKKADITNRVNKFKTKFGKLEYLKFRKEILTQHKIQI